MGEVWTAVAGCAITTVRLLATGRLTLPPDRVGTEVRLDDGSRPVVFRETVLDAYPAIEPTVLVVRFRLRLIGNNTVAHAIFRRTCIVNTPLFAGFPGFRTKFWLSDPETGEYSGVYEWDGAHAAEHYARTLSRVLALVSVPGSVRWEIVPDTRRDEYLAALAEDHDRQG